MTTDTMPAAAPPAGAVPPAGHQGRAVPASAHQARAAASAALSQELVRHTRLLHVLRSQSSLWTPVGLDWGAFALLAHLVKGGPRRQGELAGCAMLDPSTVSRHVAQLVKAGLVERRPDPEDGRAVHLAATPPGQATFDQVAARRDAVIAEVMAGWDLDDVEALTRLLVRLNDDFETYRPAVLAPPSGVAGTPAGPVTARRADDSAPPRLEP